MNKTKNSKEINLEIPKITFASLRKRKKLKQQDLKLLEELIQMEIAQYLEVLKLSNKKITSIRLKCCSNNKKYTKKDYIEVYIIFSFLYMNFFLFCTFL